MDIGSAGWLVNKRAHATTAHELLPQVGGGDVVLKLPDDGYQHQKHINMCGEACVVMLYKYHHDDAGVNMTHNPRGVLEGGAPHKLVERFAKLDWTKSWEPKDFKERSLAYALGTYGPLIASGEFARFMGARWGHFVLVHGIVGNVVLIADPWHGEDRRKPFDWFKSKLDTFKDDD